MAVTLKGAYSLALWLRTNAPAVYRGLSARAKLSGLGALGCECPKGIGRLGQDTTLPVDVPTVDVTATLDAAPVLDTLDPATLTPITVEASPLPALPPALDQTPVDSSPGVLAQVANFLTTGGGITAALGLATAAVQNQTARTVTQSQVARVAMGGNPAAISYRVNPATGLVAPMLATPQGTIPVTGSILQRFAPNSSSLAIGTFLSQNILWIALGVLGVVVLLARR